jgi:hypothetical protein
MAAEVGEHLGVAVKPEVLADEFGGQHLTVMQHGARPALSQPTRNDTRQGVVDEAEDGYNQRVRVHTAPPDGKLEHFPLEGEWARTFNFSNN